MIIRMSNDEGLDWYGGGDDEAVRNREERKLVGYLEGGTLRSE